MIKCQTDRVAGDHMFGVHGQCAVAVVAAFGRRSLIGYTVSAHIWDASEFSADVRNATTRTTTA